MANITPMLVAATTAANVAAVANGRMGFRLAKGLSKKQRIERFNKQEKKVLEEGFQIIKDFTVKDAIEELIKDGRFTELPLRDNSTKKVSKSYYPNGKLESVRIGKTSYLFHKNGKLRSFGSYPNFSINFDTNGNTSYVSFDYSMTEDGDYAPEKSISFENNRIIQTRNGDYLKEYSYYPDSDKIEQVTIFDHGYDSIIIHYSPEGKEDTKAYEEKCHARQVLKEKLKQRYGQKVNPDGTKSYDMSIDTRKPVIKKSDKLVARIKSHFSKENQY
jgi:hypothetical protein